MRRAIGPIALALAAPLCACFAQIDDSLIDKGTKSDDTTVKAPPAADGGSTSGSTGSTSGGGSSGSGGATDDGGTDAPVPPPSEGGSTVPTANLVGYWDFEEGSGMVAHDKSGHGHDADMTGVGWGPGHAGTGAHLDATAEILVGSLQGATFPSQGTFSLWFKLDQVEPGIENDIFDQSGSGRSHISIYVGDTSSQLTFASTSVGGGSGSSTRDVDSSFHHVVVSWTAPGAVAQNVQFYFDGAPLVALTGGTSGQEFTLGKYMYGTIDEVRLYDVSMSAASVAAIP